MECSVYADTASQNFLWVWEGYVGVVDVYCDGAEVTGGYVAIWPGGLFPNGWDVRFGGYAHASTSPPIPCTGLGFEPYGVIVVGVGGGYWENGQDHWGFGYDVDDDIVCT